MEENEDEGATQAKVDFKLSLEGSFNGFLTLSEMYTFMTAIGRELQPFSLGPLTIGKSYGERHSIKALCIGQCHGCAPATLYTALHHGREPMSMMTLAYTLRDIRNRFRAGNVQLNSLLESRQLWFIPIVNPNGYEENIDAPEISQRRHRKNDRQTCLTKPEKNGVDLNRNYGYCFKKGSTSSCEHSANNDDSNCRVVDANDGCSEIYNGEAPFSEPETVAVRNFVLTHNISNALNYHSYGGNLFWPFSCPHHSKKRRMQWLASLSNVHFIGNEIAKLNKYTTGNVMNMLKYSAAGDASDWMYGEHGIVALTPETGPTDEEALKESLDHPAGELYGFYPPKDKISEYASVNIEANLKMAWFAGSLYDAYIIDYTTVAWKQETKQYMMEVTLRNIGLKPNNHLLMMALTAEERDDKNKHRILRLREFLLPGSSAKSLKPKYLQNNETISTSFTISDFDLKDIRSSATKLYIVVADGDTCTLFSLSNNGMAKKEIVTKPLHVRPCDLCASFYTYSGISFVKNESQPHWKGTKFENFSLPIHQATLISSNDYCLVKDEGTSRCSGVGIPQDTAWQLYLAASLIGLIFLVGGGFICVKLRLYASCKRFANKRRGRGGKASRKKYKDMSQVYDSSSTRERYKDWDVEDTADVEMIDVGLSN